LRQCGYDTASIYPAHGAFMSARSFQTTMGIERFLDARDLGAKGVEAERVPDGEGTGLNCSRLGMRYGLLFLKYAFLCIKITTPPPFTSSTPSPPLTYPLPPPHPPPPPPAALPFPAPMRLRPGLHLSRARRPHERAQRPHDHRGRALPRRLRRRGQARRGSARS